MRDTQLGYKKVEGTEDERVPFGDINLKKQYVTKKGTAVAVKGISFSMTKHPACHHPSRDPRLDRGFWPYRGKAVPPHDGPALIRREDKNTARLQRRELFPPAGFASLEFMRSCGRKRKKGGERANIRKESTKNQRICPAYLYRFHNKIWKFSRKSQKYSIKISGTMG
ncbi:MAG: hypothetical protein PUE63_08310 [Lachnospiraceae bacterium]|nr:hypothetical protein [Lachnospiraceae bacterium]